MFLSFLECCEKVKISGGFWFSNLLPLANVWYKCLRFASTGIGTYTKTGVDANGRPIYKNDEYKGTINGQESRGEGSLILSFDNIAQQWLVSIY